MKESKPTADTSSNLDQDTMVVFALDIDETAKRTFVCIDGNKYNVNIPEFCLSPKLLEFIEREIEKAIKAGAICDSFLINTHRCISTELMNVNRDTAAHAEFLAQAKMNPYKLNFENYEPEYCFTYKIVENLIRKTKLKCLGVSTYDDLMEGRKFGETFEMAKPWYQEAAQNPKCTNYSDGVLVQFSTPPGLEEIPHLPLYDNSDKNQQIIQFASDLAQKNPKKRIVLKIVDDSEKILNNAQKYLRGKDLPDNVTIELYHHIALFQTEITTPQAVIQGEKLLDDVHKVLLPTLSEIDFGYEDLTNQLNYLSKQLEEQQNLFGIADSQPQTSENFLKNWLNLEYSKEIAYKNSQELLTKIEKALDDPLIRVRDTFRSSYVQIRAKIKIAQQDLFKHITCDKRKEVYDTISEFFKAKERLYFKPIKARSESKFEDKESKLPDVSDADYIKQWLKFCEKYDTEDILKKAELALSSIKRAIDATNENDEQYRKELEKLQAEVMNQVENIKKAEKELNSVYQKIHSYSENIEKNTKPILEAINGVLSTKDVAKIQCNAELILLKKKVENIDPDHQAYRQAQKLQSMVHDAVREYMGNLNKGVFSRTCELTFFHWGNGHTANLFKAEIDRLMESEKNRLQKGGDITDLPKRISEMIDNFLNTGKGDNRTFSFKTILRNKLPQKVLSPQLDEKVSISCM